MKNLFRRFVFFAFILCAASAFGAPTVSNVTVSQQIGMGLVDVYYDLAESDDFRSASSVGLAVSIDGGTTYSVPVNSVTGDIGDYVTVGCGKHMVWDAGTDWPGRLTTRLKVQVRVWDGLHETLYGFSKIPAGSYQRGNVIGDGDIWNAPVQTVALSGYYMSLNDTTKAQWDRVRTWGLSNGYTDLAVGEGKMSNHPVQKVSWYDVVKWANAASGKEGLMPCYMVDGAVYRTGKSDAVTCDWGANGYRLPTEAEWEVAARGGLTGKRFPSGDTISHSGANYYASNSYSYDLSGAVNNVHPTYAKGYDPYTSPMWSFAGNGYGLSDMAGNVFQWCWDWYGDTTVAGSDPNGPSTGLYRVVRGGCWSSDASYARCAKRSVVHPSQAQGSVGFRLARGRP